MISGSGVDFYKHDSILQSQTTGQMTISSVSKSDEGFYHCKHPEQGKSQKSWVSVRVQQRGLGVLGPAFTFSTHEPASSFSFTLHSLKQSQGHPDPHWLNPAPSPVLSSPFFG
ncbi:hypothetical protein KOW79_006696 [Hemibagrus wyckioides]|uniref:Immunoglobulin V-set domain-containing protein n=1 Tax=Hemibagrus wyckioides TaxID=337641 RepID=A0A9D3NXR8_9TELE|nr:hypothetical protein KOW79_006696 [Hemibagrus wyckioides]